MSSKSDPDDDQWPLKLYSVTSPYSASKILKGDRIFQFIVAAYDEQTARYIYPYTEKDLDITFERHGDFEFWFVQKSDDESYPGFILDDDPEFDTPDNKWKYDDETYKRLKTHHNWIEAGDADKLKVKYFSDGHINMKYGEIQRIEKLSTHSPI